MMKNHLLFLFGLVLLTLTWGCSASTLEAQWKDPDYQGPRFGKVLVVGVMENDLIRKLFEDGFGEDLRRYGVTGLASYRMFPDVKRLDKDVVEGKVHGLDIDGILITRMVKRETVEVTHPERVRVIDQGPSYYSPRPYWHTPYYDHWYRYYDRSYEVIRTPARTSQVEVFTMETNLYRGSDGKLVWSARTETFDQGKVSDNIEGLVGILTRSLDENGLI
ncbi:hypothetical protein [Geoalkalibacter subterraneus]|jgi:hypothetical protein|nr:hypothetical protein [Geoalkalibacter subterraneus]